MRPAWPRWVAFGPAGAGRRGIPVEVVDAIVADTLHTVPEDGSVAWSTRTLAARHGVSKDTVARIWAARGLCPWKVDTFKLSADPDFEAKLVDVVGLYVNPPAAAAVFCSMRRPRFRRWIAPSRRCR